MVKVSKMKSAFSMAPVLQAWLLLMRMASVTTTLEFMVSDGMNLDCLLT